MPDQDPDAVVKDDRLPPVGCTAPRSVKKKRILRLMREHHLLVPSNLRLKAKRELVGGNPKPTKPKEWRGIDMTKVLVQGFDWLYSVVVLDGYTKVIVGYYGGIRCTTQHWLAAAAALHHYEVRSWTGWYRQGTLAIRAPALLRVPRVEAIAVEAFKKSLPPPRRRTIWWPSRPTAGFDPTECARKSLPARCMYRAKSPPSAKS
jgi:hypothetical protein